MLPSLWKRSRKWLILCCTALFVVALVAFLRIRPQDKRQAIPATQAVAEAARPTLALHVNTLDIESLEGKDRGSEKLKPGIQQSLKQLSKDAMLSDISDGPADLNSLSSYAVVLKPRVPWLKPCIISGQDITAKILTLVPEMARSQPLEKQSDLQLFCIYEITRHTDLLLLDGFYKSAGIPQIEPNDLTAAVNPVDASTSLITVTDALHPTPLQFFVPAEQVANDKAEVIQACLAQAATSFQIEETKAFLSQHLSDSEYQDVAQMQPFREADLLKIIKGMYDMEIQVPDYKASAIFDRVNAALQTTHAKIISVPIKRK